MIYVTTTYRSKVPTPKTKMVRTFKKCNIDLLSRDLEEAPWGVMDVFDTIDEKWQHWKSLFLSILDSHAPLIKVRPRQAQSQWISDEIRAQMKSRNYYMKKYGKTRDPLDWEQYRQLRNSVKQSLKTAKKDHFNEICNDFGKQPRKVCAEVNKAIGRKRKPRITHIDINTQTLTSPQQIANEMNTHFLTVAGPPEVIRHSPCLRPCSF